MHTFQVWFRDGSAIMLDADSREQAEELVREKKRAGLIHGAVRKIEQKN